MDGNNGAAVFGQRHVLLYSAQDCALGPAGADWQIFNASQKQMRRAMLSLYGSKKRLVPPRAPLDLTGPMGRTIHAIFLFQVRMLPWPLQSILIHVWAGM